MCRLSLSLLSLALTSLAAVAAATDYSYTIHNDGSIGNLEGAVHTWLSIDGPGKATKYFSFSNAPGENPMKARPGISTVDDNLKRRTNTESFTRTISEVQYNQLSQAMDSFYNGNPLYQLIPVDGQAYNCVTAVHHVLSQADIKVLTKVVDPITVGTKFATWKSVLKRCAGFNIVSIISPIAGFVFKCTVG